MKLPHDGSGSSGGATARESASPLDPIAATATPSRSTAIVLSFDELAALDLDVYDDDTRSRRSQPPLLDFAYVHALSLTPPPLGVTTTHDYQHMQQHRNNCNDFTSGIGIGGEFFHLQTTGALRIGGPVALLSRQYGGYALSAALSGYIYVMLEFVLMRIAPVHLGLQPDTAFGLRDLLHLQWSVVLLLGLLSDALAPCGLRRNAYIVGGWTLVSAAFSALYALTLLATDANPPSAAASAMSATCIAGAMLFLVVLTNATDIRVVELAQQETLATRGKLVATYQILRIGAQVVAHTLIKTLAPVRAGPVAGNVVIALSPRETQLFVLHLVVLALVPIPFVIHHAFEARVQDQATERETACVLDPEPRRRRCPIYCTTQFRETCRQFLRSAQQQAVWQLVALNCVLYFFSFLEPRDVARALALALQQPPDNRLTQSLCADIAFVAVLVGWRIGGGVTANWRTCVTVAVVSGALVYAAGNTLIALHVARDQLWLPVLQAVLKAPFRVLLLFSAFIPTVEVAQLGSEGTIFGLLSSFQSVVKVLGDQLADAVAARVGTNVAIDLKAVATMTPGATTRVLCWVYCVTGVKLLALLALCLCPRQKLDAQQRRIYGSYSRSALIVFLSLYALSYPYASYTQYAALHI